MEAVRTNIEGTDNMLHAAIEAGVERVVCLSTDKAAYPINAMGISKAMMEHVITANARVSAQRGGPVICFNASSASASRSAFSSFVCLNSYINPGMDFALGINMISNRPSPDSLLE